MSGGVLHMDGEGSELESDLVDLAGVDLEQLGALPRTVFARSLCRILAEEGSNSGSGAVADRYASFQDYINYEAE